MAEREISPEEMQRYHDMQDTFISNIPEYPGTFEGRGVVICAGRPKYFIPAWVCVKMLRQVGCQLPIEFWYMGPQEMDDKMRALVEPLGVTCIDALEVRKDHPIRHIGGWELNPFSILWSRFKEVIFLDADNVPLVNPEFLFDTLQFQATKAIFWPDYGRLKQDRKIWEICRVDYRDEPEFESGQIIIDKESCWRELQLTMHINEHSDFYYSFVHGDKETYHMAWHMLKTPYSMPTKPIHGLRATMCQHDFDGRRIFQHRNMDKFKFDGNAQIRGFEQEEQCFSYVRQLRDQWAGVVAMPDPKTPIGTALQKVLLENAIWMYERVGDPNKRELEFLPDGRIGRGRDRMEESWYIHEDDDVVELHVLGGSGVTFKATLEADTFKGRWVDFEKMPVTLTPIGKAAGAQTVAVPQIPGAKPVNGSLENKRFVYIRVGYDKRILEFRANSQIGSGASGLEKVWGVFVVDRKVLLRIGPTLDDPICELEMGRDGVWRGEWKRFERMPIELVEIPK
jgi:hypothetical protein